MQMVHDARSRAFAQVQSDVEPLRLDRRAQQRLRMRH